jgi:hypothetical protein
MDFGGEVAAAAAALFSDADRALAADGAAGRAEKGAAA